MADDETRRPSGSSRKTAALDAQTPPEVLEAARNPASGFGKYVLVRELGHGGMGVVYLAWQSDLRRYVALKFIRGIESADDLARFEREARMAASLVHPNIVQVYEVGEFEGKHFHSMMLVRGRSLDGVLRAAPSPKLRDLIDWLAVGLVACGYANSQGVIHRDIKPANLMIGDDGRVYIMDFGLARQQTPGSSLTATGLAVGTPAYMSPEQAAGRIHEIDGRSDVYSFGATLYEVLTGRPPFDGTNLDILIAVMADDPPPPRRLALEVPPDLETICQRAMDKEPSRRYPGCAEFAADLRRWLEGEMILARPAGAMSRAVRRLRKHKLLAGAISAAVLAAFAALGFFTYAQVVARRAAEQRTDALAHGKELDQLRIRVQVAAQRIDRWDENLLKPPHDITATYALLEESIRELESIRGSRRDLPEADFAIGKALRRLGRSALAAGRFTAALEAAPEFSPALFERGRARLELIFARSSRQHESPRAFFERLEQEGALAPVRDDLHAAVKLGGIGPEQLVLADALIAQVSRDFERAVRLCTDVIDRGSTDPDFFLVRGQTYVGLAANLARLDEARAALQRGLADLTRAADIRRSDYEALNDLVYGCFVEAWCAFDGGEDPTNAVKKGRIVAARMREIRPADVRAEWREIELLDYMIEYRLNHGGSLADETVRANALLDRLLLLGAPQKDVLFYRATLDCWLAQSELRRGEDPRERIERALALFADSRREGSGAVGSAANFSAMSSLHLRTRLERGDNDIDEEYRRSLAIFDDLGRPLSPLWELPARANLHEMWALSLAARGRDPLPGYDLAVADLRSSAERLPDAPTSWSNLGNALGQRAERKAQYGQDPRADLDEAIAAFDHAIRVKPDLANAYNLRGSVHRTIAEITANRGGDPASRVKAALDDYTKAIVLSPGFIDPLINRGVLHFEEAGRRFSAGGDPEEQLELAQRDNEAATKAAPKSAVAWLNLGLVHSLRAAWFLRMKQDAAAELDAARAHIERALEFNPTYLDARQELAGVYGTRADAEAAAGRDPTRDLERAIAEYSKVLEAAPEHLHALNNRGTIWNDVGRRRKESAEGRKAWEAAVADFSAVLRHNPDHWRALANRSVSWKGLKEWTRAADDLDAAVKINPALEKRYRGEIERLRKLGGE